jgi:PKD repeat protein
VEERATSREILSAAEPKTQELHLLPGLHSKELVRATTWQPRNQARKSLRGVVTHTLAKCTFATLALLTVHASGTSLVWDLESDPTVVGYVLYYGQASGVYVSRLDVGNVGSYVVSNLSEGVTYYYALTAYNVSRAESGFSNEVNAIAASSAPIAAFTASTASGAAPIAMNFVNNSTGNITAYEWNFGDGTIGNTRNPTHVYHAAGIYVVSLKVTGPSGTSTQLSRVTTTSSSPPSRNHINPLSTP